MSLTLICLSFAETQSKVLFFIHHSHAAFSAMARLYEAIEEIANLVYASSRCVLTVSSPRVGN